MKMSEAREIARRTGKSYQQIFFEATGREWKPTMVEARSFADKLFPNKRETEWQATVQKALRTQAEIAKAQEDRAIEAALISAEVAAEIFPWERS